MCDQMNIREPLDTVQYKLYLIPDFSDSESAIVFKIHHNFADGLGVVAWLLMLDNHFDATVMP